MTRVTSLVTLDIVHAARVHSVHVMCVFTHWGEKYPSSSVADIPSSFVPSSNCNIIPFFFFFWLVWFREGEGGGRSRNGRRKATVWQTLLKDGMGGNFSHDGRSTYLVKQHEFFFTSWAAAWKTTAVEILVAERHNIDVHFIIINKMSVFFAQAKLVYSIPQIIMTIFFRAWSVINIASYGKIKHNRNIF